jgi:metallo-beta-lactamase family protein
MDVSIKFLGAAQTVTGSKYLLTIGTERILIDCGMFQGMKELRLRNWDSLPLDVTTIDRILLTHAHIDHTGYLPRIVKDGFKGEIICTHPTADLLQIMLRDAARLQEEEAAFAFKRGYSRHSQPEPLFTTEDAENVFPMVHGMPMNMEVVLSPAVSVRFLYTGHILGASSIELTINGSSQTKKIVFSGDIGRYEDAIMFPPEPVHEADVLVVESTYGNRLNPVDRVEEDLVKVIKEAIQLNGPVIIPAFAVGRTQLLLYYFQKLIATGAIPPLAIYVDSPMAISVTDLYEKHPGAHRIDVQKKHDKLISIFDDSNIQYCSSGESSKALNEIKNPCIIISASGMCTGGRILHHMFQRLPDETSTFLFTGFQAAGTRGRDILEGKPSVKLFGQYVNINCQVRVVNGLSAHADKPELLRWISEIKTPPKKTFITHGEPEIAQGFAKELRESKGWQVFVPEYLESFELFQGI